jgi:exocyst complex protein 7
LRRCANIQFTKNPEKYHKYRPEQVEDMIERLFDTSA